MATPKITLVAAMAKNRVIGKNNKMPWHLPEDLRHFKELTWGKPIIMGRKTFDSIGRVLPGRRNLIITRDVEMQIPEAEVFHSLDTALAAVGDNDEVMIIGGANIYQQIFTLANKIHLTIINAVIEGDASFPEINQDEWVIASETPIQKSQASDLEYQFLTFIRK